MYKAPCLAIAPCGPAVSPGGRNGVTAVKLLIFSWRRKHFGGPEQSVEEEEEKSASAWGVLLRQ